MFRDKHEVFRDKQHYQYMTKLTVYTSNITINKYSFEAPNRDKHDSQSPMKMKLRLQAPKSKPPRHPPAPCTTAPGHQPTCKGSPNHSGTHQHHAPWHQATSLHAKAHKAIRQGCKLTMTMIILPSKM